MEKKQPFEKTIVNRILKYLNSLEGCRAIKVHGGSFCSGEPDIDAVYKGRSLKLEVKRPGGKATKLQLAILDKWEKAGAVTAIVDSVEKVKELIENKVR
ncbi:MAG: VRR-NUC domain-containing protein [bacterium]